jgi:hypothetical protein
MTGPQLPDFGNLYTQGNVDLRTDPPAGGPQPPPKTDNLPDFSSVYAAPAKTPKQVQLDRITQMNSDEYDRMGIRHGALRGFIDFLPAALNSLAATEPEDAGAAVSGALSTLGHEAVALAEHPIDKSVELAKGMIDGIVKPFVQYPLELITNRQIGMSDDLTQIGTARQLTPEERDQRARSIGANVLGWVIGIKADAAVSTKLIGQEAIVGRAGLDAISESLQIAGEKGIVGARTSGDIVDAAFSGMSTRQLVQLRDAVIVPQFIRNVASGAAGGAAGGFTTGYLEGDTSADRLKAGLSYAMVAMPIGVAMASAGALGQFAKPIADMPEIIAQQAGAVAKLRMINAAFDQTPMEILFNMNNLQQSQSMAATLALHDLEYVVVGADKNGTPMQYGRNASVIPAVENPTEIMRIVSEYQGRDQGGVPFTGDGAAPQSRALSVTHARKDGLYDVLIAPYDVPKVEQDFFAKTGYVHGQQVGYGGRDQWVIESAGVPDGKKQYRMELRDLVTDERIKDVMPKDIVRLSSREPGGLALHLGRLITEDDIFDPAQGFQAMGKNKVTKSEAAQTNPDAWRDWTSMGIYDAIGDGPEYYSAENKHSQAEITNARHELTRLAGQSLHRDLTPAELAQEAKFQQLVDTSGPTTRIMLAGKELKPGINHIEVTNADHPFYSENPERYRPDLKNGVIVYVGGKKETVMVPGKDGVPVPTEVTVGTPGEIVSYLDWNEEVGYKGRINRGTNNFWSFQNAENRAIATEALKQERIKIGLNRSFSSLSEGGARSLQNAVNFYGRDRQARGRLTTYTPDMIKTRLIEDFLDHVGATPDGNFIISPDEVIVYSGFERTFNERTGGGLFDEGTIRTKTEQMIGQRGQSSEAILGRLANWRLQGLKGEAIPKLYTESKRPLSVTESRQIIESQIASDAVPTVRKEIDRAIDRTEVPFNDLINSFVAVQGIHPTAAPAVRNFLEAQIGKELLGIGTVRARLADRTSIPVLQDRVNKMQAVVDRFDKRTDLTAPELAKLADARETIEIFTARIKQINEAGPLPFSEQEKGVYSRLVTESQALRQEHAKDLVQTAQGNGFTVEREDGGHIILRDSETWARLPQIFTDAEQARDFINGTGRAKGMDLDGGGNNVIPPSAVAGHMPPPEPSPRLFEVPHEFAPETRVSKMMTLMDTVAPWFTPKRAFMIALDNTFKTRLYDDVYLPLQTAKMKLEAMKKPFLRVAKEAEDLLLAGKHSREDWQTITHYRETMSPQEIVNGLFKDRKLTPGEVDYAKKLVDRQVDIQKVFSYRRAAMEMKKQFESESSALQQQLRNTQEPTAIAAIQQELQKLTQQHQIDIEGAKDAFVMDPKHLEAVDMFDEIAAKPINEASLYGVTRLARALQNGEVSRPEFAAANKMSPAMMAAAAKLDGLYSQVARHNGIDERITNYFNHFRAYTDLPDATPARLRASVLKGTIGEMPAIASELIRSGEMNAYELDPIRAAVQYVNTTFAHRHFNDTWKAARNSAVEHLNNVTKGREAAARVINEYVSGMKGMVAPSDQLGQAAMNRFMDALGFEAQPNLRTDIVNTFLAAGSGAMLGFRPAQGVRDFVQFGKIYYSRFGTSRFNNGMKLAFQRDADGVMMLNKLADEGRVPGLSPLQFASENELAEGIAGKAGKVKEALFKASEVGLQLSGQHNAYAIAHAVAYLDTRDLARTTLLDLSRGKINKEQAYKKLSMNSYDIPVAEGFDRLVKAAKFDEATEYLAQATGTETAFVFGLQNHPFGWGTNVGKIASQFGTWAVWTRNYLTRLAGRGTAGERAASMARFASAEIATGLAGRTLGFNMRSWYMIPGIVFMGGPVFDYAQQIEDMAGLRGRMRQDLAQSQMKRGQIPLVSQMVPGSSAFSDYFQAWQLSQRRFGPVPVIGKGLGFSVDQTRRSFVDELMGNQPQLSGR